MQTALIYHPDYLKHKQVAHHPECPERLSLTIDYFKKTDFMDPASGMKTNLMHSVKMITPEPASIEDVTRVHSKEHVDYVRCLSESGHGLFSIIDSDTYVCEETYNVALLSAGGVKAAGEAVFTGEVKNAFALVRPPGHHASLNQATGFCYFDNAAVTIKYLQEKHGLKKVFLFDWDAHAPNGTMGTFYKDPSVLNMSIHQDPHSFYPGTGFVEQTGEGAGRGYTINFPVPAGTADSDYTHFIDEFVIPRVRKFKPELIVVAAGQDSHRDDSISQLNVTDDGYAAMTEKMMKLADELCDGKLVLELEGGYNLKTLPATNHKIVSTLAGLHHPHEIKGDVLQSTKDLLVQLEENLRATKIWPDAPEYGESGAVEADKTCTVTDE